MDKFSVELELQHLNERWAKVAKAYADAIREADKIMTRLLHEAAANMMSAEQVAQYRGWSTKRVRVAMRKAGLDYRNGKTLLAAQAAEALRANADLMGLEPGQMDLTSPLAYLPMGREMAEAFQSKVVRYGVNGVDHEPEFDDAEQLARKLDDAGILYEDAKAWVNDVIATGRLIP